LEAAGGRDALDLLQKEKPAVVLLDVGLPQMFGFELCDIIKKSPLLKEIGVILVASIYDKTRYKRQPSTLYGADDFIERHQIEEELVSKINQLIKNEKNKEKKSISESDPIEQSPKKPIERGNISQSTDQSFEVKPMEELHPGIKSNLPVSPGENGLSKKEGIVLSPETSIKGENLHPLKGNAFPHEITLSEPAMKACTSAVTEIPQKEERKDNSSVHDGARRLARIIISDIALYNQKNVEAGLQKGKFSEVLKSELEEGKKLYQERVSPEIFNSTDYFEEAIQEFIAKRRAKVK
jgi:CheY-like chemotaxis protein